MLTYFVQWVCEISKFHVAAVQRRLRNVQKRVMHVQSFCFADLNLLFLFLFFFSSYPCRRWRCCFNSLFLRSRNFATMVTWRHTSLLLSKKIFSFAPCKVIHGQTWVMDSTMWIPILDAGFRILRHWNLHSGFQSPHSPWFRIPHAQAKLRRTSNPDNLSYMGYFLILPCSQ